MSQCPTHDELRGLLTESLTGPEGDTIRSHVRACTHCQSWLDAASDDAELSPLAKRASVRDVQGDYPELPQFLDNLRANPISPDKEDTNPFARESLLQAVLGPPRVEGDLGELDGYRILSALGSGGMGIVLLGFDEGLQRQVAIKVLRPDLAGDDSRRRFAREVKAAASVTHDNVVAIHYVSETRSGLPYCVFEYMTGGSLAERILSKGRLDDREAATIMMSICHGLTAAHARDLVHRDVKPSNILFDGSTGRAKIADFGLARVESADDIFRTQKGILSGTPAYMSPEQVGAGGTIGAPIDVYGVGVTLYEALTGEVPFRGTTLTIVRQIERDDPRPPRDLNDEVSVDLETICLKCLNKTPQNRYPSADALADDFRRFLEDRPIAARRPSPSERMVRWCRRNPLAARLIAALALGVVVSGSLATWAIHAEKSARASAREAVTKTEISDAIDEFVRKDLLAQASAFNNARGGILPDPDLKVRTALDRASARIGGGFQGRPRVEAAIQHTIGETYLELGLFKDARPHLERALLLRRQELGESHAETLEAMRSLGTLFLDDGKLAEAEALLVPALEGFRRVRGAGDFESLAAMQSVGQLYYQQEKYDASEKLLVAAWDGFRKTRGEEHPQTLQVMNDLAIVYCEQGKKLDEAEALLNKVVAASQKQDGPEHPVTLVAKTNLATVYGALGRQRDAQLLLESVLPVQRRVLGNSHPETLVSMVMLGEIYRLQGKLNESEVLLVEAWNGSRKALDRQHLTTDAILANLATLYAAKGEFAKVEPFLMEAVEITRFRWGRDHGLTAGANRAAGYFFFAQKRFSDAEPYLRELLRIHKAQNPDDWDRFDDESWLGGCLIGQRKFEEAEPMLLSSYKGMKARDRNLTPEKRTALKTVVDRIIELYEARGDRDKAEKWRSELVGEDVPK